MQDILILRLDAPLVSFGGDVVDNINVTRRFPARSMLTGLLGNALGYEHRDADRLAALQMRLRYAARCDRRGKELVDYQTVDLGQPHLSEPGWTTRGTVDERGGGAAKTGTHIRYRHYLADSLYTVALALGVGEPSLEAVASALSEPARPLFLGRKCCLPSGPILIGRTQAATLLAALEVHAPVSGRGDVGERVAAWWPADEDKDRTGARLLPISDERDWHNQVHVGRRFVHEGTICLAKEARRAS